MILYHASKEVVEFPEIRKTRYTKDLSWGIALVILSRQCAGLIAVTESLL